jgi:hypothetical protein
MKKSAPIRRRSVVEEIEPRILYSADFNPGLLAAAPLAPPAEQRTLDGGGDFIQQSTQVAQTAGHEVVFVDTAVPDYQKLVDDITANSDAEHQYDVVLLKSSADGIKQISETLVGMHEVSAVHIISHGSDGQVQLGDAALNFDSLLKNASQIKGWGQALASGADLLIYGCDVAEYADGKALMNALFRLTGADVAASTDATGAAALGGNWDLEYRTGATITPFAEPGWNGVLATQTLDWDAQTWAGGSVGPHSYAVGGGNVTVTIQPNFSAPTQFTNGTPELNTNNQGGLPVAENGLNIGTNGFQPGEEAVITIGFSHPGGVSNVSFSVFDIDTGGAGGFIDEVQAGYTASGPVTLTITPSADNTLVAPDTVRGTSQGSQNGPNSGDANAIFSFTGSGITQITMHYRNVGNSNNEAITLHDITFDDNAPPVLATGSVLGYTENQAASAINSAITVSDVDSATLASATVSVTGNHASGEDVLGFVNNPATMGNISGSYNAATGVMSLTSAGATATTAQWQVALRAVTYLDSSNNPSTLARTISYVVNDGAANSNTVTSTVNITAVNDAPALAGGSVLAYTENQAATAINTAITVSDVDNATLASATVSITGNFASGEDVLGFVNGAGMGNIAGAYNALTGVMTLSSAGATATVAQWQTALRAVTYLDSSNNPSTLARTISYVVNDGAANSNTVTSTVNITAVNDAPTLSGVPATYAATEQTTLNLAGTGITVGDVDGGPPGSETLTLSVVSGVLNAAAGGSGAGVAGSGSNTLTLTGTIAQLNNLLTGAAGATLSYINNSDTPPASDTLSLSINDNGNSGSGGAQTANASSTINITAVNDAPTLVIPGAQATGMNAPIIFSGANLISAGDVDAGAFSEQITVSVTQGTLNLSGTAGLTLIGGANGSASMTYQGTLASLNAALNGLTYTPNLNYAGADTLSIASDDLGNSGGGGALGANGTVNLTVQANQAPTLSATANNPTFTEAAGLGTQAPAVNVFSAANAGTVEAGQNTIGLSFTVGGLLDGASECVVVDGSAITLGANSVGVTATNGMGYTVNIVAGTATVTLSKPAGVSAANINALINGITYQNTNTDNPSAGNRVFSVSQIQDSGGTANGGQDTTALATTSTVNVMPVNDAPFLVNDTLAIVRGGSVVLSSPNLSATDIDSPAAGLTFSVSNVLDGQFEMVSTPGVAITSFTQGAIVGGQVRFVHDGSISPPAFDLTVSDGTLSAGPTAATIVFSVPAGGPIIAPPTPTPPAPASNPGNTPPAPPPSSQVKPAQPVVTPVVTLSGGLPMAPEPVGIELYEPIRGANPYLQVDARPPKANLNPAPLIKPAEQTLLIAGTDPQYMEFGPLTKVDWSAQTAFPSADRNPSEHDQIMVIMESVRMGGIALSVGVVWWASRVTGLIGSLLASMPAWRQLDPLPIVGRDEEEDRWEETEDSEADADELAVSMVLEGPRSRDPVSA